MDMFARNIKVAYIILVVAVLLAVLFYPFMTRINNVVSTSESAMLPKNVESIEVMNIVNEELNASSQGGILFIVSGVPVSLSAYYRLNDTLNVSDDSWITVFNGIYFRFLNTTGFMLNTSLRVSRGLDELWTNVVNVTARLDEARESTVELTGLLRNADLAYFNYYQLGKNLSGLYSQLLPRLELYGAAVKGISDSYSQVYFNALRVEYALVAYTSAYQTMNLTPQDVEVVIESCPEIYNFSQPTPQLVEALFNYVLANGGPSKFSNGLVNNFTYYVERQQMAEANETSALELLQRYYAAFYNISSAYPLGYLINNLTPVNQYRLYYVVNSISNYSSVRTFMEIVEGLPLSGEARLLALGVGERYAASGFNNSELPLIAENVTYAALSQRLPNDVALGLARAIAFNNVTTGVAAYYAAQTILAYLPSAYESYAEVISEAVPRALLTYDANATGLLYTNFTYAEQASVGLESKMTNTSPELLQELINGANIYYLSIEIINRSVSSPQVRALLLALNSTQPMYNYTEFESRLPALLNETLLRLGFPSNISSRLAESTVRVLANVSTFRAESASLAEYLLNSTFSSVLPKLKGTLVQDNMDGFIIIATKNLSYQQAVSQEDEVRAQLTRAGFSNATVMLTGTQILDYELSNSSMRSISESDTVSTLLVLIILAIVLEGIVIVAVPFVGIGVGLIVALGAGYLLASNGVISVNTISRTIMYVAGLGLGIDYASLLARRFKEEYARTGDSRLAAENALRRSWRAVVTGALTAAIGFGSMAIATNFPFVASLGEAVPISILVVMALSLTVTPALLAVIGGRRALWWPSRLGTGNNNGSSNRGAARPTGGSATDRFLRRSALVLAIVLIVALPAIYAYATFKGSYDFTLMMPQGAESVTALHYLTNNYAAGLLYPDYVVAPNVSVLTEVNRSISGLACVQSTRLVNASTPILEVTLSVYPMSSQAIACTQTIREIAKNVSPQAMVGGEAAINLDLRNLVYSSFYHRVYPVAIALMFIVLLVLLGSAPMALTTLASVVLSAIIGTTATIGIYHLYGITLPWYLPIVVFTAILGVGMDYNSFIINRIREESEKHSVREAVSIAVRRMGPLVTGLSVIMAGAFSGLLAFSAPGFRGMGLALMIGVFTAGLMASYLFTPAVAYLLGERAWWPSRVRRSGE